MSGAPTQEISTVQAGAAATERGTRWTLGVSVQGMATSPYPQAALVARARERLTADGFSKARIARILDRIPVATHNQMAIATLHLGRPASSPLEFDAVELPAILEAAMSSEIFELMKRTDEVAVVERAHRRPRYVEDSVRAIIAGVVERYAAAPAEVFVSAAQENVETIHGHHVIAERAGLLGDLRREPASGQAAAPRTSLRDWLETD